MSGPATAVLASLAIEIGVPVDELRASLLKAKTEVKTEVNNMSQEFDKLKNSVSNIAQAIGAMFLASKAASFIKETADVAARTEVLDVIVKQVGKTAGYSATEIQKYVDGVKKMGITTQAADQVITKFIQRNLDLSKSAQLARVAQDAAVIGGTNSSAALEGIVHGITTQQIEVLRTYGIVINIEQELKKQAVSMQKSASALTQSEKQQAILNAVLTEGAKISGTYEASMGAVGKQIQSLPRYIEEAKNILGNEFLPILSELVLAQTKWLSDANNIEILRDLFSEIASVVKVLASNAISFIDFLLKNSGWIKDFVILAAILKATTATYALLLPLAKTRIALLFKEAAATGILKTALDALKAAWISNPFGLVMTALGLLAGAIYMISSAAKKSKEDYSKSVNDMLTVTNKYIKESKNLIDISKEYETLATKVDRTSKEELRLLDVEAEISKLKPGLIAATDTFAEKLNKVKLSAEEATKKLEEYENRKNQLEGIKISVSKAEAVDNITEIEEKLDGLANKKIFWGPTMNFTAPMLEGLEGFEKSIDKTAGKTSVTIESLSRTMAALAKSESGRTILIQDQLKVLDSLNAAKAENAVLENDNSKAAAATKYKNEAYISSLSRLLSVYANIMPLAQEYAAALQIISEADAAASAATAEAEQKALSPEARAKMQAEADAKILASNTELYEKLKKERDQDFKISQAELGQKIALTKAKFDAIKMTTEAEIQEKAKLYSELLKLNAEYNKELKKKRLEAEERTAGTGGLQGLKEYYEKRIATAKEKTNEEIAIKKGLKSSLNEIDEALAKQGGQASLRAYYEKRIAEVTSGTLEEIRIKEDFKERLKSIDKEILDTQVQILTIEGKTDVSALVSLVSLYKERLQAIKGASAQEVLERLNLLEKIAAITTQINEKYGIKPNSWDSKEFQARINADLTTSEERLAKYLEFYNKIKQKEGETDDEFAARKIEAAAKLKDMQVQNFIEQQKGLQILKSVAETAYSGMVNAIIDKQSSMADKMKAIYEDMRKTFIASLADMLKDYIVKKAKEILVHSLTEKAKTKVTVSESVKRSLSNIKEAATGIVQAIANGFAWLVKKLGPWGLVAGAALAGGLIASFSSIKKSLGFVKGGVIEKGQSGFFEGFSREIIAPEKDFKEVFESYSKDLLNKASLSFVKPVSSLNRIPVKENTAENMLKIDLSGSFVSTNEKSTVDSFYEKVIVPAMDRYNKRSGK